MDRLYTMTRLYAFGLLIDEGDEIKIHLDNGEILIGNYDWSNEWHLEIIRDDERIAIMFEDVERIERL